MAGLFNKCDAGAMFEHLKSKWVNFYKHPTEEGLIDTLFPMYHLREWIFQGKKIDYDGKPCGKLSREEALDKALQELPDYLVVRSLCNHTKHYSCDPKRNREHKTVEIIDSPVGLMKCGDSLNSSYFLVDGRDVRDIFMAVYRVYYGYFG
ncbi:hypothetical protein HV346_19725 [Enterobacter sp. RHBSTW-00994]|uniref:hypothetical protein n=1 Tax=Enterobacter sp. RHBSTW-00994 TaxID=2742676 RepID=UPI0015E9A277|nr:hypothetical protein [Enterobacter sp. RHBSTW-00994]QLR44755.1 hypothetical protein HV346_19725 [Enterobacter sp. RHBSTW-00994]